jgi:RNA polymerase sigma-70 factor, ECF subfamily
VSDWEALVRDQGRAVYLTAFRILGHAAEAEEVVQDAFLAAWRARGTVENWPAWLRHVATRRALDRLRRPPSRSLDGLDPPAAGSPEADAIGNELSAQLRAALTDLAPREAEVFCLRYLDGLANQEIAVALGIAPGAVGVALHKARAKLESRLRPIVTGEGRHDRTAR